MIKKLLLVSIILLSGSFVFGQQKHAFVIYFTDKGNSTYSVSKPEEFLSSRAVKRRFKQLIPVTEQDLPVNKTYVDGVKSLGANTYYTSRWFNAVLVETDSAILTEILKLSYVQKAELASPAAKLSNTAGNKRVVPGTSKQRTASAIYNAKQNKLLGVDYMHQQGFLGQGMVLAVFDGGFTGVNNAVPFQHIFTDGRMLAQYDFTDGNDNVYRYSSHGTKALSTIAAIDPASYTGIAPQASFALAVTEDVATEYRIEEYNWLFAAEWADSLGADVISSSLGYNTFDDRKMDYTIEQLDGQTTVISRAANLASERGIIVVVSAGNAGNTSWRRIVSPADADLAVAVGAIDTLGNLAAFSSVGPSADAQIKPEVVAVGTKTYIVNEFGQVVTGSGTSYAAPQVAGLVAGLWQAKPELTSTEIRTLLNNSGNRAGMPDNSYGYGIPSFYKAIQLITTGVDEEQAVQKIRVFPNPLSKNLLSVEIADSTVINNVTFSLFSITGHAVTNMGKASVAQFNNISRYSLDVSLVQPGIYILNIHTPEKTYFTRIIKL